MLFLLFYVILWYVVWRFMLCFVILQLEAILHLSFKRHVPRITPPRFGVGHRGMKTIPHYYITICTRLARTACCTKATARLQAETHN